ncbi:MAG: citrate/2-methylcitrate synthase [Acidimicrobiales bacterium]
MNDNEHESLVAPAGLKGLIVADTTIGSVQGGEGFYHYRQYDAVDVARNHTFEEAAALLLDGDLTASEADLRSELGRGRRLDPSVATALFDLAGRAPTPLAGLRAGLPLVAADVPTVDQAADERRREAIRLIAVTPTVLAGLYRRTAGRPVVPADPGLRTAADYLRMVTGSVPRPELVRAVEIYLILTAEHGFNASTFTARVVTSTGASVGAALTAAVGALSGPLHGGAPSRVLDMIEEIGDPARTEVWAQQIVDAGRPIMGFGHAVYRADDPRSTLLREVAIGLGGPLVERALEIEERMLRFLAAWKPQATLVTNVEFYAAVVLHLAGIPQEMFTPTFTVSRMVGWSANVLEQAAGNKIIRPDARYVGPTPSRAVRSGVEA